SLASGTTGSISGFAHLIGGAVLNNAGTLTQTATLRGDGSLTPGGTVNNSGTWSLDSSGGGFSLDQDCCSGQNVLNNSGTLGKAGNGQVSVGWAVNNNTGGTVSANAGTLADGDGTRNGSGSLTLVNTSGAALSLSGGTLSGTGSTTLATGTTSSISGVAHLTAAAAPNNPGTLTQTATLRGDGSLHPGGTANNSGTWAFDSTSGGFSLDQDCCSGQNVLNN